MLLVSLSLFMAKRPFEYLKDFWQRLCLRGCCSPRLFLCEWSLCREMLEGCRLIKRCRTDIGLTHGLQFLKIFISFAPCPNWAWIPLWQKKLFQCYWNNEKRFLTLHIFMVKHAPTDEKVFYLFWCLCLLHSAFVSPTSNTLLAGTFTELLPPWDAVRRALGWLHWNYKWFYLGRRAETPFSWVDRHGQVVSGTSFLTKFQTTKQPPGLLSFALHCTAKHCPSLE